MPWADGIRQEDVRSLKIVHDRMKRSYERSIRVALLKLLSMTSLEEIYHTHSKNQGLEVRHLGSCPLYELLQVFGLPATREGGPTGRLSHAS